jgi:hypothetical protein
MLCCVAEPLSKMMTPLTTSTLYINLVHTHTMASKSDPGHIATPTQIPPNLVWKQGYLLGQFLGRKFYLLTGNTAATTIAWLITDRAPPGRKYCSCIILIVQLGFFE